ncbi:MAG: energy transducer TonB [Deefgea sp.]
MLISNQLLKRDLPPLPVAVLFSLGLHLIALLCLLNWILQVGYSSKPKPQAPLQVSLQGQKAEHIADASPNVVPDSTENTIQAQAESEPLPQIESVAIQTPPIESDIAAPTVYWPRSQLSTPPQLQTSIVLTYPEEFEPTQANYETILSVYINEYGQVDRVEVEDRDFPEALAQAAIMAFQSASYQAGARDNQAVKARIRIAISFDAVTNPVEN